MCTVKGTVGSNPTLSAINLTFSNLKCAVKIGFVTLVSQMKKIFSIVGVHASETPKIIFNRKIQDVKNIGQTFWIMRSNLANPNIVQNFCSNSEVEVYFIAPATVAGPTKIGKKYSFYSSDKINWDPIPNGISDVTGSGYALIMDKLELVEGKEVDLNQFVEYQTKLALKFSNVAGTLCCIPLDVTNKQNKIKTNRIRKVHAIGRLKKPYCAWMKRV